MRRALLVAVLAHAVWGGTLSARTPAECEASITARDRTITELRGQVERLRYAAGERAAEPGTAALSGAASKAQHAETIAKVARTSEELAGIRTLLQGYQEAGARRGARIQKQVDEDNLAHRLQVLMASAIAAQFLCLFLIYQRCRRRHDG